MSNGTITIWKGTTLSTQLIPKGIQANYMSTNQSINHGREIVCIVIYWCYIKWVKLKSFCVLLSLWNIPYILEVNLQVQCSQPYPQSEGKNTSCFDHLKETVLSSIICSMLVCNHTTKYYKSLRVLIVCACTMSISKSLPPKLFTQIHEKWRMEITY